ncbi:MBL fold metallo-hydrolase [Ruegeria aquimaris]|uniref:MBL fold metallo-hydrolase n=1 Tax=Ruegeria aquimaris TaxID=2984333 RepID=A0ABT3ALQ9_9RHOB|nr:MBL fold metallo-hydrolase [Ruegeria sp. XHP0148]MCV2889601.1 MBL fold metallo-hydrolase [Ruegeria sp. XHP0148]
MKIRLLNENLVSDLCWLAEYGFSAWIEYGDTNILFDTGWSDVWRRNAKTAGIDLDKVGVIALSHFHSDHSRGLLYHSFTQKKKLVLHPRVMTALLDPFIEPVDRHLPHKYAEIEQKIRADFQVVEAKEPLEFAPGAFFLGQIPRVTPFERGYYYEDPMDDDTALAFRTKRGAVVVTGCSHSGICNICTHAKEVTGQDLYAVIGGFHLVNPEKPAVNETIEWFKTENIPHLFPVHCVSFDIQARLQTEFGYERPGAGSLIEL